MRKALWHAAVLFPVTVQASFGGTPCKDFACHFGMIGIFLGVLGGLPISGLIFIVLHLVFANPQRSKVRQLFLGGLIGLLAFEVAAFAAALVAAEFHSMIGHHEYYPLIAFAFVYVLIAIAAVLHARSSPRLNAANLDG